MTEKEKMTAGKIYDPSDEELVKLRDYLLPLLMNEQVGF